MQEVFSDSPDYFYMVLERLAGGPVFDRIVKKVCRRGINSLRYFSSRPHPTVCVGSFLLLRSSPMTCSRRRPVPYRCDSMNAADTGERRPTVKTEQGC